MTPSADSEEAQDIEAEVLFRSLGERELKTVLQSIPTDRNHRFALFLEVLRTVDYRTIFQSFGQKDGRLGEADFQILSWGWNRAASHLLAQITERGIPSFKSTLESRQYAMALLHQLGRSVLMHRAADMLGSDFLSAEQIDGVIVVRKSKNAASTFVDLLEFSRLEEFEANLDRRGTSFGGWEVVDPDDAELSYRPGSFLGRRRMDFEKWRHPQIDSLMLPLIQPWDSGRGVMMGYGAEPEIDYHFLAEAAACVQGWRSDAGVHPTAKIGDSTGAEVMAVALVIISLHLKHVRFALLAAKHHPTISFPQSLTIWGPKADLVQSIADLTQFERPVVEKALNAITLQASEGAFLQVRTEPFVPLLIDLGNEMILRPVSSLARNPLLSIITLAESRNPASINAFLKPREDWLRSEIYGLFQGRRYERVDGTVRLRENGRIVTDVDAIVFDRITGELALIQIKWQDYHTNDVRRLRSKARNLVNEIDEWATSVSGWLTDKSAMTIAKTLRLNTKINRPISAVYLFGISHSVARTRGYGYVPQHSSVALANWPQFFRVRTEVGPAPHVFDQMHRQIQSETVRKTDVHPLPVDVVVCGQKIRFEDLWVSVKLEGDG